MRPVLVLALAGLALLPAPTAPAAPCAVVALPDGNVVTVREAGRAELHAVIREHGYDAEWWWPFARAVAHDDTVLVLRGTSWGRDALVAHEVGHLAGLQHTWRPTTMNPWGPLRWHDAEGLVGALAPTPCGEDA